MKLKAMIIFIVCLSLVFCASSQKKLQKSNENDPNYQYNMGLFYLNNGEADKAIQFLNKAILLDPNYTLALNALGMASSMKGDFEGAVKYYQKCLSENPAFTEVHNNLGSIYQEMGFLDRAEEEYRKAMEDKAYHSRELPYYNMARLYFLKEQTEEALNFVEKSIELNSRMVLALNLKGIMLEKLGKYTEAIESYEEALNIAEDDINISFNLAVALFKNEEFDKAKSLFEKILPRTQDPEKKKNINDYLKMIKN